MQKQASAPGIRISAEDPIILFIGDLEDTRSQALPEWQAAHPHTPVFNLKSWKVEVSFRVLDDGTPENIPDLLRQIVQTANSQSPFGFRVDGDNDKFSTFVPIQTRNAAGDVVQKTALLDLHVDIASGERTIAEHGQMLADVLSAKSGIRVYCCQSFGVGVPWGRAKTIFAAQDLPARWVLEQLIELDENATTVGPRYHWLLNCQPNTNRGTDQCFINLTQVRGGGC